MKTFILNIILIFANLTLFSQNYLTDSLFGINGSGYSQLENSVFSIDLIRLDQGDFRIAAAENVAIGPWGSAVIYSIIGFNNCGEVDTNFAIDGKLIVPINYSFNKISNDAILLAGETFFEYPSIGSAAKSPSILKLLPDGSFDTNFSYQDINLFFDTLTTSCSAYYIYAEEQNDGKIFCIGQYRSDNDEGIVIVKYMANGGIDYSFDELGFKKISIQNLMPQNVKILKTPEGKYNIVSVHNELYHPYIMKIDGNGNFENVFGNEGFFVDSTEIVGSFYSKMQDDKLLILKRNSYSDELGIDQLYLLRYNLNGIPDSSFGVYGKSIISINIPDIEAHSGINLGFDLIEDNKILIGFNKYYSLNYKNTFILNSDGFIDSSFAFNNATLYNYDDLDACYGSAYRSVEDQLILAGLNESNKVVISRFSLQNTSPNIIIQDNMLVSGISSNYVNIQWFLNGEALANSTSANIEILAAGEYVVEATDIMSCGVTSDIIFVNTVDVQKMQNKRLVIAPIPSNSILNIYNIETNINYKIYNMLGHQILSGNISSNHHSINLQDFVKGVYMLQLENFPTQKFIKQ